MKTEETLDRTMHVYHLIRTVIFLLRDIEEDLFDDREPGQEPSAEEWDIRDLRQDIEAASAYLMVAVEGDTA